MKSGHQGSQRDRATPGWGRAASMKTLLSRESGISVWMGSWFGWDPVQTDRPSVAFPAWGPTPSLDGHMWWIANSVPGSGAQREASALLEGAHGVAEVKGSRQEHRSTATQDDRDPGPAGLVGSQPKQRRGGGRAGWQQRHWAEAQGHEGKSRREAGSWQ